MLFPNERNFGPDHFSSTCDKRITKAGCALEGNDPLTFTTTKHLVDADGTTYLTLVTYFTHELLQCKQFQQCASGSWYRHTRLNDSQFAAPVRQGARRLLA